MYPKEGECGRNATKRVMASKVKVNDLETQKCRRGQRIRKRVHDSEENEKVWKKAKCFTRGLAAVPTRMICARGACTAMKAMDGGSPQILN